MRKRLAVLLGIGLAAVLVFWLLFVLLPPGRGTGDSLERILSADLTREAVSIDTSIGAWYPGALYEPADFEEDGDLPAGDEDAKFGTHRIVLPLEQGKNYGLTGCSASYAQRVWVNGVLLSETGIVSASPESFVPETTYYTVYFTADAPVTELVIQRAHFNHQAGYLNVLRLGGQEVIAQLTARLFLWDGIIAGALLGVAVFFLIMYLFFHKRRELAFFAAACFCVALHYMIYQHKAVMLLLPDLPWALSHKLELVMQYSYFLSMLLYGYTVLEVRPRLWLKRLSLGGYGAAMLFLCIAPSTVYTRATIPAGGVLTALMLLNCAVLLLQAFRTEENLRPERIIAAATMAVMVLCWLLSAATYLRASLYVWPAATLLFVFCNAVILTIRFSRAERRLDEAERREQEAAQANAALERLGAMKSDFLQNISHEMKTPLTIIGSYAALAARRIRQGDADEGAAQGLDAVEREAVRLGRLVEQVKDVSLERGRRLGVSETEASALLQRTADFCLPICQRNGNRLTVRTRPERFTLPLSEDAIFQVLFNLVVNANRHTRGGTIALSARLEKEAGFAIFSVADDGDGIPPELLEAVFRRGVSGDGGPGLGLAICQELVEEHGGTIRAESTPGTGTRISFTLPRKGEG